MFFCSRWRLQCIAQICSLNKLPLKKQHILKGTGFEPLWLAERSSIRFFKAQQSLTIFSLFKCSDV